jgi:hypothetical protein
MRQADGQGVSGIRGRRFGQAEERADHEPDLAFIGTAATDDGLFHAARRIFVDRQPATCGGQQRGAASGAKGDGGAVALHIDDCFARHSTPARAFR